MLCLSVKTDLNMMLALKIGVMIGAILVIPGMIPGGISGAILVVKTGIVVRNIVAKKISINVELMFLTNSTFLLSPIIHNLNLLII